MYLFSPTQHFIVVKVLDPDMEKRTLLGENKCNFFGKSFTCQAT